MTADATHTAYSLAGRVGGGRDRRCLRVHASVGSSDHQLVAADGSGFAAAGWRADAGNGSAVVWRSGDGRTWIHQPRDVSFSGAGLACVLGSPRLMVGGTMGWPDTHAAQVWVAPSG